MAEIDKERTRCQRIADEVENIVTEYGSKIVKDYFKKQIKAFNKHMTKWYKVQQELRDNPKSKSYYSKRKPKSVVLNSALQNPMLWDIEDKLCCYYATLATIHDAVKLKPMVHLSEGLDLNAAYMLYRYSSKPRCTYGEDGLDTALKYVKADLKKKSQAPPPIPLPEETPLPPPATETAGTKSTFAIEKEEKESSQKFLRGIAEEVDHMFRGRVRLNDKLIEIDVACVRERFAVHCNIVAEKYRAYLDAEEKEEAEKARKRQRRQKKQGKRHRIYLPPDPTKPTHWARCGALACYYSVLANIHCMILRGTAETPGGDGWFKQRNLEDVSTKSGDVLFVLLSVVWGLISDFLGGYDKPTIERALDYVKIDLRDHCGLERPAEQLAGTQGDGAEIGQPKAEISATETAAKTTPTDTGTIYIKLDDFNVGQSRNLLDDLLRDMARKGIILDESKHGRDQPKKLRKVLKDHGLEEVKIKKKKNRVTLKIPANNIVIQ